MPANRRANASAVVSAEKTSFTEVTSQLDPGGNFFLYLGTAQWLEHLSTKVEAWRTTFTAMPDLTPDNTANVNKAFDLVNHLITDSGVEDITGMGMSSVEIEKGMFRNKAFLHHYPGTGNGFLWKLCGKAPHALTGLDLLPANTALAGFSDMDLPLLWTVTQDEVAKSGFPQAQDFIQKLPAQFEEKTKLKWDAVLNSFGGECGFVLTLNESNTIPIPLPNAPALTIPEPGLLLVLKVNDDTIFNRIDQELKKNPSVISVEQPGLKMRTMPVPLPFIGTLRPTTASSGGYLLIASSDELVNAALAVKSGKSPGLKASDEFKRLSKNIPDQGNQFTYMSERFGRIMFQVQQQAVTGADGERRRRGAVAMDAGIHAHPSGVCLFRRREHPARLSHRRQRQPELRQHGAAAGRRRAGHAGGHRHSQFCQSPQPPRRKTPASTTSASSTPPKTNGRWRKAKPPATFAPRMTSSPTSGSSTDNFRNARRAAPTPSIPSAKSRHAASPATNCHKAICRRMKQVAELFADKPRSQACGLASIWWTGVL